MAPLAFEKPFCGPSLDMFNKYFAHENAWELEHTDSENKVNFVNNVKLARDGSLLGFTHLKGECGMFRGELKMQNAGPNHVDVTVAIPQYKDLSLYSKYAFDSIKKSSALTLAAEHVLPFNTTQFKYLPFVNQYSAFSLFTHNGGNWSLSGGAEVSGGVNGVYDGHVLGVGYKNSCHGKTYMLSARIFGGKEAAMNTLVGNVYAATAKGNAQNALSMALEHRFEDATTRLRFAGLWQFTDGTTANPSYVKAKCDTDGDVAVTYFQRFNEKLATAVGVNFKAREDATLANASYGFKVLIS